MNWSRVAGRILLALGVFAIGIWATRQHLLNLPPIQFWLVMVAYLAAAEGAWTFVDRKNREAEARLPRQGLYRLPRWDHRTARAGRWMFSGGRPRLADITARHDAQRECLGGLVSIVTTPHEGPRVHLISGEPGSGRSTLLLRLGRTLADQGHQVFTALPGPVFDALSVVLQAARSRQVFLLVDDLDMRPGVETMLYEISRAHVSVTVVGTACPAAAANHDSDGLAAVQPANLLSYATIHQPQILANDLTALSRKLETLGSRRRPHVGGEMGGSYVAAVRHLQGAEPFNQLWADLAAGSRLPRDPQLLLALAGVAELGLPLETFGQIIAPGKVAAWQRAGIVATENGLVLPPHRATCLDLLQTVGADSRALAAALASLLDITSNLPTFAPRLLFGLAHVALTRPLALAAARHYQETDEAGEDRALRRLWHEVYELLGLVEAEAGASENTPPELSALGVSLLNHGRYEAALSLYQKLTADSIYQPTALFNRALALAHLDRLTEAQTELNSLAVGPPGTRYLQGVIAEKLGDYVAALDHYEASRKADELQVAATRRVAFTYLRTGAPRAAIALFEAVLGYTPQQADLYGGLAVAHLHSGTAQRAAAQSARAIQAGVDPGVARKAVARALTEVNAYDRVAAELEACVAYDAEDDEASEMLSGTCRCLGRFEREEECLRHLLTSNPANHQARLQLGRCYRDQGRAPEALQILKELLADDDHNVPLLLLTAEVADACGDPALSRAMAEAAVGQGDRSGWGYFWLGRHPGPDAEAATGALRRAITCLEQSLAQGAAPRQAARLYQAIYLAARQLGDEAHAERALRAARKEGTVCRAIGSEIESVVSRRSVPADVYLDEFSGSSGVSAEPPSGPVVERNSAPAVQQDTTGARLRFSPGRLTSRGG